MIHKKSRIGMVLLMVLGLASVCLPAQAGQELSLIYWGSLKGEIDPCPS